MLKRLSVISMTAVWFLVALRFLFSVALGGLVFFWGVLDVVAGESVNRCDNICSGRQLLLFVRCPIYTRWLGGNSVLRLGELLFHLHSLPFLQGAIVCIRKCRDRFVHSHAVSGFGSAVHPSVALPNPNSANRRAAAVSILIPGSGDSPPIGSLSAVLRPQCLSEGQQKDCLPFFALE